MDRVGRWAKLASDNLNVDKHRNTGVLRNHALSFNTHLRIINSHQCFSERGGTALPQRATCLSLEYLTLR